MSQFLRMSLTALFTAVLSVGLATAPAATAAPQPQDAVPSTKVVTPQEGGPEPVKSMLNVDGRWEQFTRESLLFGSGCAVWHRWETSPGGPWSGWASLGGCIQDWGIDASWNADGRIELFAIGTNYGIFHNWQTTPAGGPWSGWYEMPGGGVAISGPYVYGGFDRLVVYVVGTNGGWYANWQNQQNCCWSGWYAV